MYAGASDDHEREDVSMMEDPVVPSTARMIDYWLGGQHHFPVDVAAANAFEGAYGPCAAIFRSLRDFSRRTVTYLADHAGYAHGDATNLASIDPAALAEFLPGWRRAPIGLVFLGLAAFLDDPTLARTFEQLHRAVPDGSMLAFDFDGQELADHPAALAMMGDGFHMRDPAGVPSLLGDWRLTVEGIVPVAQWRPDGAPAEVPDAFYGGVALR
jgi:hypothetical protein